MFFIINLFLYLKFNVTGWNTAADKYRSSCCSIQALALFSAFCITRRNVSGCRRRIFCFSCPSVCGVLTYTLFFKYPHKKSGAVKSGEEKLEFLEILRAPKNLKQHIHSLLSNMRSDLILLKPRIRMFLHCNERKCVDCFRLFIFIVKKILSDDFCVHNTASNSKSDWVSVTDADVLPLDFWSPETFSSKNKKI